MKLNVFRNGWMSVALVAAGIPLAFAGIVAAESLPDSIVMMAVWIFASILIFSLVLNGAITLGLRRSRPLLLVSPLALPLVQGVLLVLETVWIVALITQDAVVVIATSASMAGVSTAVFVLAIAVALLPKGPSNLELSQRRGAARDTRTPAERRRRKVRAVVITGVLFAAVAVPVILVQTTTTVHPRCDVNGAFYSGGTIIVSSINCGDFARPGDQSDYDAVSGRFETYDIVTRGFWLGHPLLVELRPVEG